MSKFKNPKLIIFTVVFLDLLGFGVMIPMLPFYGRFFNASATEIGLLMFVYSVMQLFLAPIWGSLSDRVGRVPILLTTIFGQGIGFVIAALAPNFTILLLSRLVAGAFAANISTANAYMADITTPEERSKGMGLLGAAFGLGFVFGPVIGALLIHYGVEWPSIVAAGMSFLNFIWAMMILKEPLQNLEARAKNRRRFSWQAFNEILADKKFFFPIFLFFLTTFAFTQMEVTFGLFMLDEYSLSERSAGLMMGFLGVLMAIVQGALLGRFLKFLKEHQLIILGCIFIILGLSSIAVFKHFYLIFGSLMLMALGYGLLNPCLSATVSKQTDRSSQGRVMGIYQSSASLGRIVGPITAGLLYDRSYIYPFLVGAAVILVGLGIFSWGQSHQKYSEAG